MIMICVDISNTDHNGCMVTLALWRYVYSNSYWDICGGSTLCLLPTISVW